ncbi:hypothetical protein [Caldovatus aquaticus]|uniref:Uncharacterized protein n=1 Tax=Caldovatus aquaticus TaxID=2865671 RepID=A0ABS7EY74_9PROT|nr:hypothetical protein [Caldovatus aquaticus]MBW8268310.1 hypothetical protein [Caldovatus aquaticus]
MPKPNLLPVFVDAGTYGSRLPASVSTAAPAIIEAALTAHGLLPTETARRAIAAALRMFAYQVLVHDQALGRDKSDNAGLIRWELQVAANTLGHLCATEEERAAAEAEEEKRAALRERLRAEAQLARADDDEDDEADEAEAA